MLIIVEYCLNFSAGFYRSFFCVGVNDTLSGHFESYFRKSSPQIFYFTEYSYLKAALAQFVQLYCSFIQNFVDLFIMVISIGVADKFKQLNYNLELHRGIVMPEKFWQYYRQSFQELSDLVSDVDRVLGNLILLSFSNNLYFICVKLLHIME